MKRRKARTILCFAGPVILLAFFFVTYHVVRAVMATPRPTMSFIAELDRLAMEGRVEGEPTAWPVYERINREVLRHDEHGQVQPGSLLWDAEPWGALAYLNMGDWGDPRHDRGKRALADLRDEYFPAHLEALSIPTLGISHAEQWERYKRRTGASLVSMEQYGVTIPIAYSYFDSALRAELRYACEHQDWGRLLEIAALGAPMRSHLFQAADHAMLYKASHLALLAPVEIRALLNEHVLPREVCERLLELFHADRLVDETWERRWIDIWRLMLLNEMEWKYGSNGVAALWMWEAYPWRDGEGHLNVSLRDRLKNLRALLEPDREQTRRAVEAYFEALDAWWFLPMEVRPEAPDLPGWVVDNPLIEARREWIENSRRMQSAVISQLHATRLMLHLNLYYLEHGRWPDALEDAAPRDEAIDPRVGEPFRYVLTPDAADGRPYDLLAPGSLMYPRGRITDPVLNPGRESLDFYLGVP